MTIPSCTQRSWNKTIFLFQPIFILILVSLATNSKIFLKLDFYFLTTQLRNYMIIGPLFLFWCTIILSGTYRNRLPSCELVFKYNIQLASLLVFICHVYILDMDYISSSYRHFKSIRKCFKSS